MTEASHLDRTPHPEFIAPAMVEIPEGWFLMGSDASQPGQDNERPVHRVWVDAFEMAACQITNAEYARFCAATSHRKPPHGDDPNFSHSEQPVVAPSWFDAVAFCEWLEQADGQSLPAPDRGGMGASRSRRRGAKTLSLGRSAARIARKLFVALESGSGARGPRRAKRLRPLRHRCERARVVLGLV